MNTYFMVDVESDGPIPGTDQYSMVCFCAVKCDNDLKTTFYGETAPISNKWIPEALAISGFSREEHEKFQKPIHTMYSFADFIKENTDPAGRPIFIADNNGFDWQFINWYFHAFTGKNPFGFSSQNLGSLYKGMVKDMRKNFKHLRKTKHTHNPVDDAIGNAEAFMEIMKTIRF